MTSKEAREKNELKLENARIEEFAKYFQPFKEDINNSIMHIANIIEKTQNLVLKEIEAIKNDIEEVNKCQMLKKTQSKPQKVTQ